MKPIIVMFPPVNHEGRRRVDDPRGIGYTRWLPSPPWKANGITLEERIEQMQQEREEAFKLHMPYHNPSLCSTTVGGTTPEGRSCLVGSTGVEASVAADVAMQHSTRLQTNDEGETPHRHHQLADINNHKYEEVKASPPPPLPSRSSLEVRSPKSINPSVYQQSVGKHHHHPAVYHRVINNTSSIDVKHSNMCPVIVATPPQQAIAYPPVGSTFYGGIGVVPRQQQHHHQQQQQQYCYFA